MGDNEISDVSNGHHLCTLFTSDSLGNMLMAVNGKSSSKLDL